MEPWLRLDRASDDEARALLRQCCGATRWIERMVGRRPFASNDALLAAAREEWFGLDRADWLEAFADHPRIGDRESLRQRFADTAHLAEREQAGVTGAAHNTLDALAAGNREYEQKFGYIFIVFATGKSAGEMHALLRERLGNLPDTEVKIAAAEQAKITRQRLMNL
jgi:2-oxo-4-hydroxy-4-carboxy-5-ureidoimidazoline decarboxylase